MRDDGLRGCKLFLAGMKLMVFAEEAPANYVSVVAVICRGRVLFGFIGCKELVGSSVSRV